MNPHNPNNKGAKMVRRVVGPRTSGKAKLTPGVRAQVNFLTPEEYFWSVDAAVSLKAEQGGVYNRSESRAQAVWCCSCKM